MDIRTYLNNLITAKEQRATELREMIKGAETADEVRSLGDTLQAVLDELTEARNQLEDLDEGDGNDQGGGEERSKNPLKEFRAKADYGKKPGQDEDPTNSQEYRTAFMNFVMRGTRIPMELRDNTLTTDAVSVIPTVVINKIIEKMDEVGTILNLVTRTSYAAGVVIPTSATKPVATWVSEGAGSDRQKKTTGKITFTNFKLRCEVSVSMEVHTMALSAFEAKLAENVANAMVKAIEDAIINGDGDGKPTGIMAEAPIDTVDIPETGIDYATLCKVEGAVAPEYEGTAKWCMSKKMFMSIMGMVDQQGQPIARINFGLNGKPERSILGRDVVITEHMAADYERAFVYDFSDYILNTVYDMGIQRKQDWDTEDMLTKAVMSVDGKSTSRNSLVLMQEP